MIRCAARSMSSTPSWATKPAFGFRRDQSVFELSPHQITQVILHRLYAQNTDRARWGCASLTGFIAPGESPRDIARADSNTLKRYSLDHETVARRMVAITNAAVKRLESPTCGVPVLVEDGKFEVTLKQHTLSHQFCPFSPEDDTESNPWSSFNHVCASGNNDWKVRNTTSNKVVEYGGLLPHLIGAHHFFLGSVPYRLNPVQVIETLELAPPHSPDLQNTEPASQPPHQEVCSWVTVGHNWMNRENVEKIVAHRTQFQQITPDILRLDLAYDSGSPLTHLFNTNGEETTHVHQVIDGALLDVLIPPNCLLILKKEKQIAEANV